MKQKYICGLDIGQFKTSAICARLDASRKIDILAAHSIATQGVRAGRVIDAKKLSACIKEAISKLGKMCGMKVRRVYANIDSPDLRANLCTQKAVFKENTRIKEFHIEQLIDSAISSNLSLGRRAIHFGFSSFILDNQEKSAYPEGRYATEIEINIIIVSALIPTINSLLNCIKGAGLVLEKVVPSACAQAQALFNDCKAGAEKDIVLIDVGAGLSKLSLFRGKLLKDIIILPLGAQSITENIAERLGLSFDCAEQLKVKYGLRFSEASRLQQKIIIKDNLKNRIVQPQRLHEAVASKVDYLLQEIKRALLKLNFRDEDISEIIFTGGGSILEGFLERAEMILGKPTKMGFLYAVKDNQIQAQSPLHAASVGLVHFGARNRTQRISLGRKRNRLPAILKRAKMLYEEYF